MLVAFTNRDLLSSELSTGFGVVNFDPVLVLIFQSSGLEWVSACSEKVCNETSEEKDGPEDQVEKESENSNLDLKAEEQPREECGNGELDDNKHHLGNDTEDHLRAN